MSLKLRIQQFLPFWVIVTVGGWPLSGWGQSTPSPQCWGDEVPLLFPSSVEGEGTVSDPALRLDLRVSQDRRTLKIQLKPQTMPLTNSDLVRPFLDAAVREASYCLQGLHARYEAKEDKIFRNPEEWNRSDPPLLVFPFRLAVRSLDGTPLQWYQWEMGVFWGPSGAVRISGPLREVSVEKQFSIADLLLPETYPEVLKALFSPVERVRPPLPEGEFVVELNYRWPLVPGCIGDGKRLRCRDAASLFVRGWFQPHTSPPDTYYINLGKTYCRRDGAQIEQFPAAHLNLLADTLVGRNKAFRLVEEGSLDDGLKTYQNYFKRLPSDRKAARSLLNIYRYQGFESQAETLVTDFQPYFVRFREPRGIKRKIQRNRTRGKRQIDQFSRDENVWVRITYPQKGDTIAGKTPVRFLIAGGTSPVLQMDLLVNGQIVQSSETPPLEMEIGVVRSGPQTLGLRVNFENGTYQEDVIPIETLSVDETERVNLVELQAVVASGRRPLDHLQAGDFQITENRRPKKLNRWSRANIPLRVAVLVDTSVSMAEGNIYVAQEALYRFISRLRDPDRSQVYSFNEKVLLIKDFEQSPEQVKPIVFSLSPGSLTALNDALLTARSCLEGEVETTPVLVVIAGGDDNRSSASSRQIKSLMARSPVRVYAALFEGGQGGLLTSLAENSGGFARTVRNREGLQKAMDQIFEEIRNLYYLDYYTSHVEQGNRKLSITVPGRKHRVKWRVLP